MRGGNSHQSPGDRVAFRLFFQSAIKVGGRLAERSMSGDKPVRDGAQHRISFASSGKLVAEGLPLLCLTDPCHSDTKRLEDAPDVAFQVLAQPDQTFLTLRCGCEPR